MDPSRTLLSNFHIMKKFRNRFYSPKSYSNAINGTSNNKPLMDAFEKIASSYSYSKDLFPFQNSNSDELLSADLTPEEVRNAIKRSKKKSAPGFNRVTYTIFKYLPIDVILWLTKFFNFILSSGSYPQEWKKFKICFISKGSNRGYRPISLASTLLKTLERCVNDKLMWWCESRGIFRKNFNGFRRCKSCSDCLAALQLDVSIAKEKKELSGVLSLDLEGAYDKVKLETLLIILRDFGFPSVITNFIYNLIADSKVTEFFEGSAFKNTITYRGLPQGCILSPLLFNLYIANLIKILPYDIRMLGFTDDIILLARSSDAFLITEKLNFAIDSVNGLLSSLDLKISFDKCSYVFLGYDASSMNQGSLSVMTLIMFIISIWGRGGRLI